MGVFYQLDDVDAFTTAALGRPGARIFYLQVRQGEIRVTVKCEKQQASAIAEYLRKVMNDLPSPNAKPLPTTFELIEPVFLRNGGRPHWGKLHSLKAPQLAALYPRWTEFLEIRRELDPQGRLLNPYLKGLFGVG